MILSRRIEENDRPILAESLAADTFHQGTNVDFFYDQRSICNVYEDDDGPVMVVRGTKALRLDIQYLDNNDAKRNMRIMLDGFDDLAHKARESGFTEIVFNTNSPLLAQFCKKRFGFVESAGELRRFL
jgi:hypothetical protein